MSRRPLVFDMKDVAFDADEPLEEEGPFDPDGPADSGDAAGAEPTAAANSPSVRATERPAAAVTPAPIRRRRRVRFLSLFAIGVSGLTALALTLSLTAFVEDLLARAPVLGWLAAALTVLAAVGLVGMAVREWLALRHLKAVEEVRRRADRALAEDDREAAAAVLRDVMALYADRASTARGRRAMRAHMREIIDGRDLLALGERELMATLDRQAIGHVVSASRRVAAVTALSPRALVDVGFVIFASLSMVRRIAMTYGGRPGTLGFLRVLRHAVAHLAVTGGMAAGDSLVGEVIGKGIAAKLSAKLGEGIVNGLMTARLGLAALDVLRPLPFHATRRPRVNDVLSQIARIAPKDGA